MGCGTHRSTVDRDTGSESSCGGRVGRRASTSARNSHCRTTYPRRFGRRTEATDGLGIHGASVRGAGSGRSRYRWEAFAADAGSGKSHERGDRCGWERVSLAGYADHGTGVGDFDGDGVESFGKWEGELVEPGDGDGGGVEE